MILYLDRKGKTYAEIRENVRRSRFTIRSTIKRFAGSSNLPSKKRTDRPRALSKREEAQIVQKINKKSKLTCARKKMVNICSGIQKKGRRLLEQGVVLCRK